MKKKLSAGGRLKKNGKSLIWSTYDDEEKSKIRTAAAFVKLPMSQLVSSLALAGAEKILKKFMNQA